MEEETTKSAKLLEEKDYTVEDLIEMAGTNGYKNYFIIFLCLAVQFVIPMHLITYEFLGEQSDHRCLIPEFINSNWTEEQIMNYSIPFDFEKNEFSKCLMYDRNYSLEMNSIQFDDHLFDVQNRSCKSRHFLDSSVDSVVTEFDLVCDRKWLYPSTGSAVMLGTLLGSFLAGYLFDTFGRRTILVLAMPAYLCMGIACSFSQNISTYIMFRTIIATIGMVFALGPFTLSLELCSTRQRFYVSLYASIIWSIGYSSVGLVTYLFRPWRYLQIALTSPVLLQLPNFWFIPESPRWLINRGRYNDALKTLKDISRSNKRELLTDSKMIEIMQQINRKGRKNVVSEGRGFRQKIIETIRSLTAIIRIKELRSRSLIIFFCWYTVTMVYYGVSLNATSFSSNKYIYVVISGILEFPSGAISSTFVEIFGRRKSFAFFYISCGFMIFIRLIYSELVTEESTILLMVISLTSRFMISSAFTIAFLYTNELYPTQYRSIALGEASGTGRFGSILSPFINNLLVDVAGWAPSAVFGAVSVIAGILALQLPETKGVTLQEYA